MPGVFPVRSDKALYANQQMQTSSAMPLRTQRWMKF